MLITKGKDYAAKLYQRTFFDIVKTPKFMKGLGLTGDKFTIRYGVIARHFGKDGSHDMSEKEWEALPEALEHPFAITRLADKERGYRLYTTLKNSKGEYIVIGVDVKNTGRDIEVNAISTLFGRRENAGQTMREELVYTDKEITPEQMALLDGPNFRQYPSEQESVSGTDSSDGLMPNASPSTPIAPSDNLSSISDGKGNTLPTDKQTSDAESSLMRKYPKLKEAKEKILKAKGVNVFEVGRAEDGSDFIRIGNRRSTTLYYFDQITGENGKADLAWTHKQLREAEANHENNERLSKVKEASDFMEYLKSIGEFNPERGLGGYDIKEWIRQAKEALRGELYNREVMLPLLGALNDAESSDKADKIDAKDKPLSLSDIQDTPKTQTEAPSEQSEDKPEEKPTVNPSGNKLVTDERYAELKARLRNKFRGQLNIGIDPEILAIGAEMAVYHIEKGARKFADFVKAIVADLEDMADQLPHQYLKGFYKSAHSMLEYEDPSIAAEMDDDAEVNKADVATIISGHVDAMATAEMVDKEQQAEKERAEAEKKIIETRNQKRKEQKKTERKRARIETDDTDDTDSTVQMGRNNQGRLEDFGEEIAGARKDMLKRLAKEMEGVTEQVLIKMPLSKAVKRPAFEKYVSQGLLTTEDALVAEALWQTVYGEKKPSSTRKNATLIKEWARSTTQKISRLKEYLDATDSKRAEIAADIAKNQKPDEIQEREHFEQVKQWNPDQSFGEPVFTPDPVYVNLEIMRRMGVSYGEKLQIPVRIVTDRTHQYYEFRMANGRRPYGIKGTPSLEEAIEQACLITRLENGDKEVDFPAGSFRAVGVNPITKGTGKFIVSYLSGSNYKEKLFDTRESAEEYATQLHSRGAAANVREQQERTGDYERYQIQFTHPVSGEYFKLEGNYSDRTDARIVVDEDTHTLSEKVHAHYSKQSEKKNAPEHFRIGWVYINGKGRYSVERILNKKALKNPLNDPTVRLFDTRAEAEAWYKENKERLERELAEEKQAESKFVYFEPNRERHGRDYRQGRDVTPDEFTEMFGFRGVQFGNWTNTRDRQAALNETYDAFRDLANVLGVSERALSLNGELGLAFGSRGSGSFNAHYEPVEVVINLTKTRGAGSLAHEWWHALDNYIMRKGGEPMMFATEHLTSNPVVRPEVREAFRKLREAVTGSDYDQRSKQQNNAAYWGSMIEETARLFAEWVDWELGKNSERNHFLSRGVEDSLEKRKKNNYISYCRKQANRGESAMSYEEFCQQPWAIGNWPYPIHSELEAFDRVISGIFSVFQERTGTTGGTELFTEGYHNREWRLLQDSIEEAERMERRTLERLEESREGLRRIEDGDPATLEIIGLFEQTPEEAAAEWREDIARYESALASDRKAVANARQKAEAWKTERDRKLAEEGIREDIPMPLSKAKEIFDRLNKDGENGALMERIYPLLEEVGADVVFTENLPDNTGGKYDFEGRIYLPAEVAYGERGDDYARYILHEMLHGVTSYALEMPEESLSPALREGAKMTKELFDAIRRDKDFEGEYGIKNNHELLAEISNPRFRKKLKLKDMLGRFLEAMKRLLGLDKGNGLDAARMALDKLINNFDKTLWRDFRDIIRSEKADAGVEPLHMEESFEARRAKAVRERGTVAEGLADKEVTVVEVKPHDFDGERPIAQARRWAKENIVGEHELTDSDGNRISYNISRRAIDKYLSGSAIDKSSNPGVHLSVLKQLPEVISQSVEAEVHPDYNKGADGIRSVENGYREDNLIHRFYGAVMIDGNMYRVKTTIIEPVESNAKIKPHSYEVAEIELLPEGNSSELEPTASHKDMTPVGLAKLLQGVEKSYDKGVKLLDASENSDQKEKVQQIIDSQRTTNTVESERIGLNLDEVAKIVETFENPTLGEEKSLTETERKVDFWITLNQFVIEGERQHQWAFNTVKSVRQVINLLKKFDPSLTFDKISAHKLDEFVIYQQRNKLYDRNWKNGRSGYSNETIIKNCRVVKWMLRWAASKGYIDRDVERDFSPSLKTIERPVIFLKWKELMAVYNLDLNSDELRAEARDFFCFCCFTSLRFSDAFSLKRVQVKEDCIEVVTQKTGKLLKIELNKYSRAILDKYKDAGTEYALPHIPIDKLNSRIRTVGKLAKIDEPVTVSRYYAADRVERTEPKYKFLTSHCGRRTFICNALALGISPNVVMKWTGHSEYSAMKPYIDIADEIKANAMSKFDET